jgi:hypothetical protein
VYSFLREEDYHILLLVKIQFKEGVMLSLGKLIKINNTLSPKMVLNSLEFNYNKIIDSYNVKKPVGITFNYLIKKGKKIPSFQENVTIGTNDFVLHRSFYLLEYLE